MSAADWTRNQRRKAGLTYLTDAAKEVNPPAPSVRLYGTALLIPRDVGSSKIRRTASDFTNYTASRMSDFILYSQGSGVPNENGANTGARKMTLTRICGCKTTAFGPKVTGCTVCSVAQNVRIA
jgi:hypothetical protein